MDPFPCAAGAQEFLPAIAEIIVLHKERPQVMEHAMRVLSRVPAHHRSVRPLPPL